MSKPAVFHVRIQGPNGILTTTTPVTAEQAEDLVKSWTSRTSGQYPTIGTETLDEHPHWPSARTAFRTLLCIVLYHYATDAIIRVPGDFFDWFHVLTAMWVAPTVAVSAWRYSE